VSGARARIAASRGGGAVLANIPTADSENPEIQQRRLREAAEIVRRGNDYVRGWVLIEDDGTHTHLGGSPEGVGQEAKP